MTTREISTEAVTNALNNVGLDEDDLREDYSGRGMYGTTCLAIVSSSKDAMRFMICLAEEIGTDEAMELAKRARTDSMGMDIVTYWPGVLLSEEL